MNVSIRKLIDDIASIIALLMIFLFMSFSLALPVWVYGRYRVEVSRIEHGHTAPLVCPDFDLVQSTLETCERERASLQERLVKCQAGTPSGENRFDGPERLTGK